jgi:hypothetical protein
MRMRCNSTSKSSHLYCYLVVMDITRSSMADSTMRVKVRYRLLSSDEKNFAQTKWCEGVRGGVCVERTGRKVMRPPRRVIDVERKGRRSKRERIRVSPRAPLR